MSVAIALVARDFGLVATDARRVENGGRAIRDDYDKSFAVAKAHLIGASVGLLEFGGLTIAQHVQQVVDADERSMTGLETACRSIGARLAERMVHISEAEVSFQHRRLKLLIVARSQLQKGEPRICSVELQPDPGNQRIDEAVQLWDPADYFVTVGDDASRRHIILRMPKPEKRFLLNELGYAKRRLTKVMGDAIAHCGPHPLYPRLLSCGGLPCVREIKVAES